ncbi:MAG: VOC family protein [Actinomycetes bacterium]
MTLNITGTPATVIPVSDHDAAISFYCDRLGFLVVSDEAFGDGHRWVEVSAPGSDHAIAFGKPPEGSPIGVMTGILISTSDIDADHAAMAAMGIDVDPAVMRQGDPVPPMFWFRDQDSNILLLVERNAGA